MNTYAKHWITSMWGNLHGHQFVQQLSHRSAFLNDISKKFLLYYSYTNIVKLIFLCIVAYFLFQLLIYYEFKLTIDLMPFKLNVINCYSLINTYKFCIGVCHKKKKNLRVLMQRFCLNVNL